MKQYHARQTENGWIVVEGGSHGGMGRDNFGYMGKEYVFISSEHMGRWLAMRDEQIKKDEDKGLSK